MPALTCRKPGWQIVSAVLPSLCCDNLPAMAADSVNLAVFPSWQEDEPGELILVTFKWTEVSELIHHQNEFIPSCSSQWTPHLPCWSILAATSVMSVSFCSWGTNLKRKMRIFRSHFLSTVQKDICFLSHHCAVVFTFLPVDEIHSAWIK